MANPEIVAPDLRQFVGKLHLRSEGDSNGQVVREPQGKRLLGRYSRDRNGQVIDSYGSTYASEVMRALNLSCETVRTHGSARFGGLSFSTGWWVTPLQLAAIRAADDVIRTLDPEGKPFLDVSAAAVAAALAKMAE